MVTNRIIENKSKGRGPGPVTIENRRNNIAQHGDEHQLVHDLKQVNINDGNQYHQPRHNSKFLFHLIILNNEMIHFGYKISHFCIKISFYGNTIIIKF